MVGRKEIGNYFRVAAILARDGNVNTRQINANLLRVTTPILRFNFVFQTRRSVVHKKLNIRVIKRNSVKNPLRAENEVKRSAMPDIVSIVTTWVSDLRDRKRMDSKAAIEKFFASTPQASKLVNDG